MNQTKKILILILTATLLVTGVYVFVFMQVRKASQETAEAEQLIEDELKKQGKESSVKNLFVETEKEREELMSRVVTRGKLVGLFEELEVLAAESEVKMEIVKIQENVELDNIMAKVSEEDGEKTKPRAHPAAESLEWMQMDIEAIGPWESTYRFLNLIELLPYYIEFSNIHLNQSKAGVSQPGEPEVLFGDWRLTFSAKILQKKEK